MKISPKKVAEAIYEASLNKKDAEMPLVLKNAVKLIKNKKLLNKSSDILKHLEEVIDKKENRVRIKVISAEALDKKEKHKLEQDILDRYKAKEIESIYIENKEVLGGVRVEIGDEVLDSTWRNSLLKLEKHLIK